ncbi:MAG TPA: response regulator [Opitutaceae bacterium]|jgi:CheY-like chemotaxis protein
MARILVVEDEPNFRQILVIKLEQLGHEVLEAQNGRMATKMAAHLRPALVLTDLVMPEKEGLELIQDIRRGNPKLPIVAMSGGGRTGPANNLKTALTLGANKILLKPFSDEELKQAIAELLPPAAPEANP